MTGGLSARFAPDITRADHPERTDSPRALMMPLSAVNVAACYYGGAWPGPRRIIAVTDNADWPLVFGGRLSWSPATVSRSGNEFPTPN